VRLAPARLVVVGSVMVDILLYLDRMPEPGGVVIADRSIVAAGAGYNLLAGAARLGLPAAYGGVVGGGLFGEVVRRALTEIRVPCLLPGREEDTGFDVGLVQPGSGRQPTFLGAPGAESRLTLADLRGIGLDPGDAVYLSGYDLWYPDTGPALETWIAELGPELLFVFDPGPLVAGIPAGSLAAAVARADLISLNVTEARALAGQADPPGLAEMLARRIPPRGWAVVRGGGDGCWVAPHRGRARHVPARPAQAVDTTGAGDAHVAALLARLAAGDDVMRAARWANIAASLAVEREGPSTCPTAAELEAAADTGTGPAGAAGG
jgi:sugar/nucleoside kinase (ribokinase family)